MGVYHPRVFCERSGINQLYFHHLPNVGEGKYTLVSELLLSPLSMWKWRDIYPGLELIEFSQETHQRNGIYQFESTNMCKNTKQCYSWWIIFNNNENDNIQMRIIFEVKNKRNKNNSLIYHQKYYVLYY